MGDCNEDFVRQFHSLEGNLIGERRKHFARLLQNIASLSNEQLVNDFIKNVEPKTYLEGILKVEALIYFKRTSELLSVLKEGNEVFMTKIMKQSWFLKEVFGDDDTEKLVNEFLPCLSYAFRMKFLNKLLVLCDQDQVDRIYQSLFNRYGLWIGSQFLHLCSTDLIQKVLKNEEIRFRPHQVQHLYDKNVVLFKLYLDYHYETFGSIYNQKKIFDYVARKNPELLVNLIKNKKIVSSVLGRRTTKKVFPIVKDDIANDFSKYKSLLNKAVMIRKLGQNFESIYFSLFPSCLKEINMFSEYNYILRYYPKSKRWSLIVKTFSTKMPNHNVDELLKQYNETLLTLHPGKELIEKWAEIKYSETHADKYLKHINPSKSVPLIKEKINVTSDIFQRQNYVNLLLETCSNHNDLKTLETVLKYICYRHRNEEVSFQNSLLNNIKRLFKLKDMQEIHWNYINEQIIILRIKKEFTLYKYSDFSKRHLEFLFTNSKEHKPTLTEYVNDVIKEDFSFKLDLENPEIEQKILREMIDVVFAAVQTMKNLENRNKHLSSLIISIIKFNILYPESRINFSNEMKINGFILSVFDKTDQFSDECKLVNVVLAARIQYPECFSFIDDFKAARTILNISSKDDFFYLSSSITELILKKVRSSFENEVLKYYFENIFKKYPLVNVVNWFLKNEPQAIVVYFQKIVLVNDLNLDFKCIRLLSHFGFDKQFVDHLLLQLDDKQNEYKQNYVKKLSVLLSAENFIKIVKQHFLPKKDKIDLQDEEMMSAYKLQCYVGGMLHKFPEPSKMLPIVMKFAIGDYLQSSLSALYGIFYRSPEKLLFPYIHTLSERAVSVRKHAIFLSCENLDQKYIISQLTARKHSNVSSQKHLFSATLGYFQKNPSEQMLHLVTENMSSIDKNDNEALQELINAKVPKRYKKLYLEKCWSFYETLQDSGVHVNEYLNQLLRKLIKDTDILIDMPISFIQHILYNYFGKVKNVSNLNEFIVDVLKYREFEVQNNLEYVLKIMSAMNIGDIRAFFSLLTARCFDKTFLELILNLWNRHFTKTDTFWEHVFLNLWLLQSLNSPTDDFAKNIMMYLDSLISEYSIHVFDIFTKIFQDFLGKIISREKDKFELFYSMLKSNATTMACILVLEVMDVVKPDDKYLFDIYVNIIDILKNVKEPIVTIYYTRYVQRQSHDSSTEFILTEHW